MKTRYLLQAIALALSLLLVAALFLAAAGKIPWLWFWGVAILGFAGTYFVRGDFKH